MKICLPLEIAKRYLMGDHLDFDIVSNFVLRISSHEQRICPLHLSVTLYKSTLFMQNKPNLLDAQMNVSSILTKYYENVPLRR